MYYKNIGKNITAGVAFLREHPQVWFTALTGLIIFGAFIFTAHRFASIAQDAQEELITVRIGSILDAVTLFAPGILEDATQLRNDFAALRAQNPTVESFTLYAPHGNSAWRVYVSDEGPREGSVVEDPSQLFALAYADPANAYTFEGVRDGERVFTTARAIRGVSGHVDALVVSTERLSDSDRQIAENLTTSFYLLGGILIVIMLLFFRHARIVDYATLYKKQVEIDEMKDSFIGMASHELKSPLTVIRGYIEMLKEGTVDVVARTEYLRRIDVSADELRQLIDDILDVSRIEMGRLRFEPVLVTPAPLLTELVDMFGAQAAGKGLTLASAVEAGSEGSTLQVDRGRLKQVLVNLVSNAIKYSLTGTITLGQRKNNNRLEIFVRDTGVGMTADEQAKLFSKFYRVEAQETKGVSGTGLGLWITKYIVEHMGGTISVESIKGEGSRFVASFPLSTGGEGREPS